MQSSLPPALSKDGHAAPQRWTWGASPDEAGHVIGQGMMNAVRGGLEADTVAPIREHKLTPHAEGGVVLQPAPGEVLASVAPGEVIVPQGAVPTAEASRSTSEECKSI